MRYPQSAFRDGYIPIEVLGRVRSPADFPANGANSFSPLSAHVGPCGSVVPAHVQTGRSRRIDGLSKINRCWKFAAFLNTGRKSGTEGYYLNRYSLIAPKGLFSRRGLIRVKPPQTSLLLKRFFPLLATLMDTHSVSPHIIAFWPGLLFK